MELELIKITKNKFNIETPMGIYGTLRAINLKDAKEIVVFLESIGHTIKKPKFWRDKKESVQPPAGVEEG